MVFIAVIYHNVKRKDQRSFSILLKSEAVIWSSVQLVFRDKLT